MTTKKQLNYAWEIYRKNQKQCNKSELETLRKQVKEVIFKLRCYEEFRELNVFKKVG